MSPSEDAIRNPCPAARHRETLKPTRRVAERSRSHDPRIRRYQPPANASANCLSPLSLRGAPALRYDREAPSQHHVRPPLNASSQFLPRFNAFSTARPLPPLPLLTGVVPQSPAQHSTCHTQRPRDVISAPIPARLRSHHHPSGRPRVPRNLPHTSVSQPALPPLTVVPFRPPALPTPVHPGEAAAPRCHHPRALFTLPAPRALGVRLRPMCESGIGGSGSSSPPSASWKPRATFPVNVSSSGVAAAPSDDTSPTPEPCPSRIVARRPAPKGPQHRYHTTSPSRLPST